MGFTSPGVDAALTLEKYMMQRAAQERQDRLDAQAAEKHQFEMKRAQRLLEREDEKHQFDLEDRELARTEKKLAGKTVGDMIEPGLFVEARANDTPMRMEVQAPSPAEVEAPGIITEMSDDGMSGETPVAQVPEGAIRFAGSPAQARQHQQDEFTRIKEANDVAAETAKQAGVDAKAAAAENATQPVIRVNPRTGKLETIGDVPKGAHFVSEPAPSATAVNADKEEAAIAATARNIVEHPEDLTAIRSITSLRGDQRMRLFNAIKAIAPEYNVGSIDRKIKFLDSYEDPKGRAAANRMSLNTLLKHGADLQDANDAFKRTNVKLLNIPVVALQGQVGDRELTNYRTTLDVVKDEVGLYFAGGYAPKAEQQKTWNKILSDEATPGEIDQFVKSIAHVAVRRAGGMNEQYRTMMGSDDPNLIDPDAYEAAKKIGLGDEVAKYRSGGHVGTHKDDDEIPAGVTVRKRR